MARLTVAFIVSELLDYWHKFDYHPVYQRALLDVWTRAGKGGPHSTAYAEAARRIRAEWALLN